MARMGRPPAEFPTAGKRKRGQSWSVYFAWSGRVYGVAVGPVSEKDAETARQEVGLALRTRTWPAWAEQAAGVRRYLTDRYGEAPPAPETGDLLTVYGESLRSEVSASWARGSLAHLRELRDFVGHPLEAVTPAEAQLFLEHITETPGPFRRRKGKRSASTRNRALAACSRFFKWGGRTRRRSPKTIAENRPLRDPDVGGIVHQTAAQRDMVLEAAGAEPDGIAAWLALYAGLRRGEVARATWADVSLERGRLTVPIAKTGRRRTVPLASALIERLSAVPESERTGRIVPWQEAMARWEWEASRLLLALQDACPDIPADRLRWNVFRHTFGSLLAQAGVSLDKISAWLGNSPAVCRRHYAGFTPRDRRDEAIDLLNGGTHGNDRDGQDGQDKATT